MSLITKILVISSLILNSSLLIYLFGLIPFLLFISTLFNLGFISYLGFLLRERNELQTDFFDLLANFESYSTKLSQIYELEMFYGDDTLEDLIRSSKILINSFYSYEEKYYSSEETYDEAEPEETNLDDDNNDTEEDQSTT